MWDVHGFAMGVNYGCEKVRFPPPCPSAGRCAAAPGSMPWTRSAGGAQVMLTLTFEVEGAAKPSCVATVVYRYYT